MKKLNINNKSKQNFNVYYWEIALDRVTVELHPRNLKRFYDAYIRVG